MFHESPCPTELFELGKIVETILASNILWLEPEGAPLGLVKNPNKTFLIDKAC